MRLFLNLLLCDTAPSCWRWWLGAGVNPHRRRTKILRELTPENSSAGYSLVTAGPLSPHPPGFLCHTYPQINSPIRNLLTKVVLKAMTLHTISLAFKKKKSPLPPKASGGCLAILGHTLPPSAHTRHSEGRAPLCLQFSSRDWSRNRQTCSSGRSFSVPSSLHSRTTPGISPVFLPHVFKVNLARRSPCMFKRAGCVCVCLKS